MATHSSVLAWRIPGMGEPGGLPSMGLHRVGHDWSNLAATVAEYIIWNAELDDSQAGIKIARRNINYLRYADDTTLMAESEEELNEEPLDEGERGEWKSRLKTQHSKNYSHGIQPYYFMANGWGRRNLDFIFLGSKITVGGDCSHEIKRRLLLGRKAMTNLDVVLKSRDVTLPTKVRIVKALFFPVVMYGCESWTLKKAKHQRTDAFRSCSAGEDSWESLGLQGDQTSQF